MSSLFRRRHQEEVAPEPVSTGIACSMPGCLHDNALPCAYRDRRGRGCEATYCPDHRVTFAGVPYCRRHGGTIQAIGEAAFDPNGLPDIDDRTPSLVNWVSRDLDAKIRAMLAGAVRPGEGVVVDDAVRLARDRSRASRWERSWRIVESTGIVLKVTVHISDEDDAMVHVTVGNDVVADEIPPWIARRREGLPFDAAIDLEERRLFYQSLEERIADAVTRFAATPTRWR